MALNESSDLFPNVRNPESTRVINERCRIKSQDGHCVVDVSGIVLAQYSSTDHMAEAYAMVSLVEQGWADQCEVARAFGYSARTVRRHQRRFENGGLAALDHGGGYPAGRRRLKGARTRLIEGLKAEGHSNREIARRVGVSEKAIRKLLLRLGWKGSSVESIPLPLDFSQVTNPNVSASSTPATVQSPIESKPNAAPISPATGPTAALPTSLDTDPMNRSGDRLMACLGLLDDAAPLFGSQTHLPRAGVLLALTPLVHSGVFECAQQIYGTIGPAFYGLRTSLLDAVVDGAMAHQTPRSTQKEHSPQNLGRVLGLDRAPEVKTLRRKLARLAAAGCAAKFGQALAQRRVASRGEALGFLYVDGHVRVYHGQHRLPKAHVARMRLSMPATSDYWVNDSAGDPLFVITAEANAGLVRMLPEVLKQVRSLVGKRGVTVVFDRGGFSPKLFEQILAADFDILTSRRDLPAAQVAYWMFNRWRQENFFKYLREEYALDALADHAVVPDDPTREVPNPAWAAADARLHQAYAHLERLQAEYGLESVQ